jgi:replicative DNA helicase
MSKQTEIEHQILGCILTDLESAYTCMAEISVEDFSSKQTQGMYKILCNAVGELAKGGNGDILAYISQKITPQDMDMSKVTEIMASIPSSTNLPYFLGQLKNYSAGRKLLDAVQKAHNDLQAPTFDTGEIAHSLEDVILDIANQEREEVSFKEVLHHVFDNLGVQKGIAGYSWGLKDLDRSTGGIELGKAYVIGGLKKSGKTKFALNTSLCLWKEGVKNGWISLEMGKEYLVRWILSHVSLVDAHSLKTGKIRRSDWPKLTKAAGELDGGDEILIDDRPGLTPAQIRGVARKFAQKGCRVIFLDFLQRAKIKTEKGENRATAIQNTTSDFADMAKEFNVALIYLSQLRADAENRIATIADLKESGGIGENVECAIVLNNMDRINRKKGGKTNIAKLFN